MRRSRGEIALSILRLLAQEDRSNAALVGDLNSGLARKTLAALKKDGSICRGDDMRWSMTPRGQDALAALESVEGLL
jgi:predicted transcriptional regulator